jgi:hypothetical protein
MEQIFCKFCSKEKTIDQFTNCQLKKKFPKCKICVSQYNKLYSENNKEKLKEKHKELHRLYYLNNKERLVKKSRIRYAEKRDEVLEYQKEYSKKNADNIKKYNKKYREENSDRLNEKWRKEYLLLSEEEKQEIWDYQKNYRKNNKDKINKTKNKYESNKRKTDPVWKCMKDISTAVRSILKKQGLSKNKISCKDKFPWTPEQLWEHIIKQFSMSENLDHNGKVWMTLNNHGKYDPKTWNENDSSTWTWQLDHIKPQSDLKFNSYDHPNFLKCWSLKNLRPYSAKKNWEDGRDKTRHEKK